MGSFLVHILTGMRKTFKEATNEGRETPILLPIAKRTHFGPTKRERPPSTKAIDRINTMQAIVTAL